MDKLLMHIKSLDQAERIAFATQCGTTLGYLRKAISAKQTLAEKLCALIEDATTRQVTRKDLRPDDWQIIWPEMIDKVEV